MRKLISRMHGGQKGFTLIELLVVIAILGVIAAIVALNVGTFFGRGTVQAANTELHQVQTAIISLMADAETGTIMLTGTNVSVWWAGGSADAPYYVSATFNGTAADYVYGPFRAAYLIDTNGNILDACTEDCVIFDWAAEGRSPWSGIEWDEINKSWRAES